MSDREVTDSLRVIPGWRYDLVIALMALAVLLAWSLPGGFWWELLSGLPCVLGFVLCFGRYRRLRATR